MNDETNRLPEPCQNCEWRESDMLLCCFYKLHHAVVELGQSIPVIGKRLFGHEECIHRNEREG